MEASIEVRVLGELSVRVEGEEQALPRSRKTRALLAYLAVTGRRHRRDRVCDLLWDVADDPRAALRWSLSKLRKTLGPTARPCLVASRDHIELELPPDALDLTRLRRQARQDVATLDTDALEALAETCRGELLEGLLLPDFDAFEAWLEAQRADARQMHARLRRALVERLQGEPERALRHARVWFQRSGAQEAQQWVDRLSAVETIPAKRVPEPATLSGAPNGLGPAPEPAAPSRALVGRASEMARLDLIARESRLQHTARVVLLLGEPGMGKTRVLEELRYRQRDPAPCVIEATFHEAERNRPMAPFLDAMRHVLEGTRALDPERPDRERLFETVAALIRRGAEETGLGLLLLDDAHLSDPSSSELLHYIVRTAARFPLMAVVACRPAELDDNPALSSALASLRRRRLVEEVRLAPLGVEAVRALIAAESPRDVREDLVSGSAGNPLVALEMARSSVTDSVPRTLADLVLTRLFHLSDSAQALVRWAAVLEHGGLATLEAACADDVEDFLEALEVAARYGSVHVKAGPRGDGTFKIAHALIQRVVYESLSPVRRAAMHRSIAELLSQGQHDADHSSIIAHHATRADRPDLAARALVDGAMGCAVVGAVGEAADLADRAMASVPRLGGADALEVELRALLVLAQVRRPEDPARFVTRLTELGLAALGLGRTEEAHRAFHVASNLRWEAGSGSDGYGLARQAWHASRTGSSAQRVRASSFMAMCLALMEKQLPDAHAMVHEAEALAQTERVDIEPAELSLARGLLHLHAGRMDEARRDAIDAQTLARLGKGPLFEALALQMRVQLELAAGNSAESVAAAQELRSLATRIREGGEAPLADAAIALGQASLEDARSDLRVALGKLRGLDDKRRLAWVANRWAAREREAGHPKAAEALAREGLEAARAVEAMSEAAIAACELMAAALAREDDAGFSEAEEMLAAIEATAAPSREARRLIDGVTAAQVA